MLQLIDSAECPADVRMSAVVYCKNYMKKQWINASDSDRALFHQNALSMLSRFDNKLRANFIVCVHTALAKDFPAKWPDFVEQCAQLLHSSDTKLMTAGLIGIEQVIKIFRYKRLQNRRPIDNVMSSVGGNLLSIANQLLGCEYSNENAGYMIKLISKTYFSAIDFDLSKCLMVEASVVQWCTLLANILSKDFPAVAVENREAASINPWWKAKKWAIRSLYKLFSRYGNPALETFRQAQYKGFAKMFMEKYAEALTIAILELTDKISKGMWIPRKVMLVLVEFHEDLFKHKTTWKVVKPHIESIVCSFLFPLLCYTEEDKELFEDDPAEYVRKKFDPIEDFESVQTAASRCIVNLIKERRKDSYMMVLQFVNNILVNHSKDAPKLDGALCILRSVSEILMEDKTGMKNQIGTILLQFVVPLLGSNDGLLLTRACSVIQSFCEEDYHDEVLLDGLVSQSNSGAQGWLVLFEELVKLMDASKDLPIRIYAANALMFVFERRDVSKHISAHVALLMELYLKLAHESDVDTLATAMERLVEMFPNEVAPFALQLSVQLRDTFMRLLAETQGASTEFDDSDKVLMGLGMLKTINTIILSVQLPEEEEISKAPEKIELKKKQLGLLLQLEEQMIPCIKYVLDNKFYDYFEEVFEMLNCFQFQQKVISANMWSMFEPICALIIEEGCDYIEEVFPIIDNYISYGKDLFCSNEHALSLLLKFISQQFSQEDLTHGVSSDAVFGLKTMEALLMHCKPYVDQHVPSFLDCSMKSLAFCVSKGEKSSIKLIVECFDTVLHCINYSPATVIALMKNYGPLTGFFTVLSQNIDKLSRVNDKKIVIASLLSLIAESTRNQQIFTDLNDSFPFIMKSVVKSLSTLSTAIENRESLKKLYEGEDSTEESTEEIQNTEDATTEDDETYDIEDGDDVPDNEAEYLEMLDQIDGDGEVALNGHADDDDDDGYYSEELEEEVYEESPLDNLDAYQLFKQSMSELAKINPGFYGALENSLSAEERTAAKSILEALQ